MSRTVRQLRLRRPSGDDGQVVTWLLVVGLLAMGMFAMKLALPLAEGGDRLGKGQTGAESAALGAAKKIKEDVVFALLDGISDESNLRNRAWLSCSDFGAGEASRLAGRNGERLVTPGGYCYDMLDDRVRVDVESEDPTSTGHRVRVKAEAKVGLDWGSCRFADRPTPSTTTTPPGPTPTTSPTTPPTPPPPPDPQFVSLTCDGFVLRYQIDPDTGDLELKHDRHLQDLLDSLEPRLTG